MFRALLWKEWRQLRAVRWTGIALGALIPVAFVAGAQMGGRVLGFPASAGSMATIAGEVYPLSLMIGLWPLIALLATAQAFAGDRAAGTESFLLERPVPRRRIWLARLMAAIAAVLTVVAGTASIAAALWLTVPHARGPAWGPLQIGGLSMMLSGLALAGGVAAASLVRAPLSAVLLGAILGSVPLGVAWVLISGFPFAQVAEWHLGMLVPVIPFAGLIAASVLGTCRGEPLGRGRIARIGGTLVGTNLAGFVLFAATAPAVLRLGPELSPTFGVEASSGGAGTVVEQSWIVGLGDFRSRRFLSAPVLDAVWRPGADEVAIETAAGPLGSYGSWRIELYDSDGRAVRPPIDLGDESVHFLQWAGDRLVGVRWDALRSTIVVVNVRTGKFVEGESDLTRRFATMRVVVAPSGDAFFVAVPRAPASPAEVRRIDLETARLDSKVSLLDDVSPWKGWTRLSPDAKHWITTRLVDGAWRRRIVDLETGTVVDGTAPGPQSRWIDGSHVAWVERSEASSRLVIAALGEPGRVVRAWPRSRVTIETSPDHRALLVAARCLEPGERIVVESDGGSREPTQEPASASPAALPPSPCPEVAVYEPETDRWRSPSAWRSEPYRTIVANRAAVTWAGGAMSPVHWAGPRTLAWSAPSALAFESLDEPGSLHWFRGGP